MKRLVILGALFLAVAGLSFVLLSSNLDTRAGQDFSDEGDDPDMPSFLRTGISKEEFMNRRAENIELLRGIEDGKEIDFKLRQKAILKMDAQEARMNSMANSSEKESPTAAWTPIGPNPIPNGQSISGTQFSVSGRVSAIAVHPTNPNIVYVGTAQGGLYRTIDGGANWTPLMDNALSLAIGAVAIAPSQPETIYVGTGESVFSKSSFFGVGVYRIDNASSANPTLSGPLNKNETLYDIFTGRGISKILVHPTDPATIFVASTSGLGGISGSANLILPGRGIYRSTNATSANPSFTKLDGLSGDYSVRDMIIDPLNPNLLVANLVANGGGIFVSTNALSPSPAFVRRLQFSSASLSELTAEFAVQHTPGNANATFYAATGNGGGRVLISTDNGATWTQQISNKFCGGQCWYNIAIDVDPTNPARVYLGGTGTSTTFTISSDSGASFSSSAVGLHTDTHVIAVSPSNPSIIYFGSDGGIYKSTDSGASWNSLNNLSFVATQFMSIAVHPTDPNFTLGGTQDNGTSVFSPNGTWRRVDFGDGGYSVIDQSSTDTTNVNMYHTYYSGEDLQGYAFSSNGANSSEGRWTFRGCQDADATGNGITCNGTTLFYAPLEQGPGTPNTIYYGTDRLYRSADKGFTNTVVSQNPIEANVPISAIGISPQNDNVRVVGLKSGGIWGTTTGSSTLTNLDPGNVVPNAFVSRAVISPTNSNKAYVTLSAFGVITAWKTSNLNDAAPIWTPASGFGSSALPLIPVSSFVVDKQNPNTLYAGTDIGVYISTDDGASWSPFGTGLPRVAVFGMAITSANKLRIATHGRGMYEINLSNAPQKTTKFDFDGDGKADISVFRPAGGFWYISGSRNGFSGMQFGDASDVAVPADYDGDGKTDIAVYRNGTWYINRSSAGFIGFAFGAPDDIPQPADFDGDGKAELAVWRPSNGTWYIFNLANSQFSAAAFGQMGDKPMVGDYDGDGRADVAVFRPTGGFWYIQRSALGFAGVQFGDVADKPVAADYDGDGKTDVAVFRPSSGTWYMLRSSAGFSGIQFGLGTDLPVPADYDGDGKDDVAVFRNGTWYLNRSQAGFTGAAFGATTDKPVPNSFVP